MVKVKQQLSPNVESQRWSLPIGSVPLLAAFTAAPVAAPDAAVLLVVVFVVDAAPLLVLRLESGAGLRGGLGAPEEDFGVVVVVVVLVVVVALAPPVEGLVAVAAAAAAAAVPVCECELLSLLLVAVVALVLELDDPEKNKTKYNAFSCSKMHSALFKTQLHCTACIFTDWSGLLGS